MERERLWNLKKCANNDRKKGSRKQKKKQKAKNKEKYNFQLRWINKIQTQQRKTKRCDYLTKFFALADS